jgi:hypothetical protein
MNSLLTIKRDIERFTRIAHHDLGGQSDEIHIKGLGDEGESTRCTEIAFNHLNQTRY